MASLACCVRSIRPVRGSPHTIEHLSCLRPTPGQQLGSQVVSRGVFRDSYSVAIVLSLRRSAPEIPAVSRICRSRSRRKFLVSGHPCQRARLAVAMDVRRHLSGGKFSYTYAGARARGPGEHEPQRNLAALLSSLTVAGKRC
jgi:hypothetical protein